jgi:hypothetical protein
MNKRSHNLDHVAYRRLEIRSGDLLVREPGNAKSTQLMLPRQPTHGIGTHEESAHLCTTAMVRSFRRSMSLLVRESVNRTSTKREETQRCESEKKGQHIAPLG